MPNYGLLAQQGRREDNAAMGGQVAHISAVEAELLRLLGGAGTTNPATGLPEYYGGYSTGYSGGGQSATAGGTSAAYGGYGRGGQRGGPGTFGYVGLTGPKTKTTTTTTTKDGPRNLAESLYGDRSRQESTPLSKEGENVAEGLTNFVTSYEGLKSKLGKAQIAIPIALDAVISVGLKSFAQALTNTGGYYGAGQPGGVNPYSTPATVQLADVIAAPLAKPVEGEPFILPTDPTALEEGEETRQDLLALLPNIEGFTPEIAALIRQFVEEELALGSTA